MSLDLKVPISSRILSITWPTTQTSVVRMRPFYSTRCSKWTVLSFAIKLKIRRPRQENLLGEAKKKKLVGQWRTPTKQTTGDPGSVTVPQYGSSKITVFVWGYLWTDWTPKHLVAWRLPTNWKPRHTPRYSQMCVRKIISALFIPQPAENHTSAILCLSSSYNPCTTVLQKKNLRLPCKHGRRIKQHFINFFNFWLRKHSNILNRGVLIKHSILLISVQVRILNSFTTKIMKKI